MKFTLHPRGKALRLIAGWCGLLLYVAAFSPLGVGLTTALGSVDRDHQVKLQSTESGLRVVLHHPQKCVAHHHGVLARALTWFAQPVNPTQPDHVLQFGSADYVSCARQIKATTTSGTDSSPVVPPALIGCQLFQPTPAVIPSCTPPDKPGSLLCPRSTVLLI